MSEPRAYQWDFGGSCAPKNAGAGWGSRCETFSLGIFQWVPKSGGRGLRGQLKRGKVIRRVKGFTAAPEEAYAKARAIVAGLNGTEPSR